MWRLLLALTCWCFLEPGSATKVDPRTGAVGSPLFLHPIYVPSSSTEAATNPNPGRYEVTERYHEGDFTTRSQPRVYIDPRVLRPLSKSGSSHVVSAAAPQQWQWQDGSRGGGVQQQRGAQAGQHQQGGLHRAQKLQEEGRADADSYRRGYNKKGFRNYENREDWGRRKEQHYGLDDPRLRAGYQEFMRFFGDFATDKGSYGNLGAGGTPGAMVGGLGAGMAMRHGAYGMPLYAPSFDLDYTNYIVLR